MKRIGLTVALSTLVLAGGAILVRALLQPPPESPPTSRQPGLRPNNRSQQPAPPAAGDANAAGPTEFRRRLGELAKELGNPTSIETLTRQAAEFELRLERDGQFRTEAVGSLRDPATPLQTRCF